MVFCTEGSLVSLILILHQLKSCVKTAGNDQHGGETRKKADTAQCI